MASGKNPPGERPYPMQAVPPLSGHKTGVPNDVGLDGHSAANWNVDKTTTDCGFSSRGSTTTSGNPARYTLGIPD